MKQLLVGNQLSIKCCVNNHMLSQLRQELGQQFTEDDDFTLQCYRWHLKWLVLVLVLTGVTMSNAMLRKRCQKIRLPTSLCGVKASAVSNTPMMMLGHVMSTDLRSSSTLTGQKVRPMMGKADNFTLFSSKKSLAAESTKPDVASSCQTDNSTVVVNDRDKPSNFSA